MSRHVYPHRVEVLMPDRNFAARLNEIELFHVGLGIQSEPLMGRYDKGSHYVTWCFRDPQHAGSFQALFGADMKETVE